MHGLVMYNIGNSEKYTIRGHSHKGQKLTATLHLECGY
jgi:hypothetical protein